MKNTLKIMMMTMVVSAVAKADVAEIYCTIRDSGGSLNCQWAGKERKVMNAEDISNFVDAGNVAAYVTLKSRKGMERTFKIDGNSPQYKRMNDIKRSASISEISTAKSNLFNEIEKKLVKLSDELDGQASAAELVLYDGSIALEKMKRENRAMTAELEGYKNNRDQACTSSTAFEKISKANNSLQQVLSDLLYSFQTPGTCLADARVPADKDGAVDLRKLSIISERYKSSCKK